LTDLFVIHLFKTFLDYYRTSLAVDTIFILSHSKQCMAPAKVFLSGKVKKDSSFVFIPSSISLILFRFVGLVTFK
jgi:hypothetical protein